MLISLSRSYLFPSAYVMQIHVDRTLSRWLSFNDLTWRSHLLAALPNPNLTLDAAAPVVRVAPWSFILSTLFAPKGARSENNDTGYVFKLRESSFAGHLFCRARDINKWPNGLKGPLCCQSSAGEYSYKMGKKIMWILAYLITELLFLWCLSFLSLSLPLSQERDLDLGDLDLLLDRDL